MRAASVYTAVAALLALVSAGLIPLSGGWWRPGLALAAASWAASARGGMCAIELTTRPEGWRP